MSDILAVDVAPTKTVDGAIAYFSNQRPVQTKNPE